MTRPDDRQARKVMGPGDRPVPGLSGRRWAAPAAFVVLWSAGFTFVSLGLEDSEPLTFLALRYVAAVALLAPLFAVTRPPMPRTRVEWRTRTASAAPGMVIAAVGVALATVSSRSAQPSRR